MTDRKWHVSHADQDLGKHMLAGAVCLSTGRLALLFMLFMLAACVPNAESPSAAVSTRNNAVLTVTPKAEMTALLTEASSPVGSHSAGEFECAHVTQIPLAECVALVALYDSTDGPHWDDNRGWRSTDTPCSWSGIDCENGHVTHIGLLYNQLTGTLPRELGNLNRLRVLALWANQLHGPIPAELGNLSELVSLELWGNQFTGTLPVELGNLDNLRVLTLGNNQLSGPIPSELGEIDHLETLSLSNNLLSGPIPPELGQLKRLNQLYLPHNELSGPIPESLGDLNNLYDLDLGYNRLTGQAPEFVDDIGQRRLWGNELDGTIFADGQMPFAVEYRGVILTADSSLADSVWPERVKATAFQEEEPFSFFYAAPEHLRITFADPRLSQERLPMGMALASEAQVLIYPLAELAAIDPRIQLEIETLQGLLTKMADVPLGDLPLLPNTNAVQVLHAQAGYVVSDSVQGLRFVTQHAQDFHPVSSKELFYTFQGFTVDDSHYVAAFFPVATTALPDSPEDVAAEDWATFSADFEAYVADTANMLDRLSPEQFSPRLTLLDAAVSSITIDQTRSGLMDLGKPVHRITLDRGQQLTLRPR